MTAETKRDGRPDQGHALVLEIGDRVWWPSALARVGDRRRRERATGELAYEAE